MNKFLVVTLLSYVIASPAFAISASYQHKLDRSGCTEITDANGTCDIHKTRAQNGLSNGTSEKSSNVSDPLKIGSVKQLEHSLQGAGIKNGKVMADKFVNSVTIATIRNPKAMCEDLADDMVGMLNKNTLVDVMDGDKADKASKDAKIAAIDVCHMAR